MRPDMMRAPDQQGLFELNSSENTITIDGDIDMVKVTHLTNSAAAEPIIIKGGRGMLGFAAAGDPFAIADGAEGGRLANNYGAAMFSNGPATFWPGGQPVTLQISNTPSVAVRGYVEVWLQ